MSLRISNTGLDAAMKALEVRSNNIANVGTTAFKKSNLNFQDLVSGGRNQRTVGSGYGALLANVRQDLTQGPIVGTSNALDLAIDGSGYFVVVEPGTDVGGGRDAGVPYRYTRNGRFSLNRDGYLVDSGGRILLGEANPDVDGTGNEPIRIDLSGNPRATNDVRLSFNLDDRDPVTGNTPSGGADSVVFDRANPGTFSQRIPFFVFDSLGERHEGCLYLSKARSFSAATPTSEWQSRVFIGDQELKSKVPTKLEFDASGQQVTGSFQPFEPVTVGSSSNPLSLTFFLNARSQPQGVFSVQRVFQNGYPRGTVESIDVDEKGLVRVSFDSGFGTTAGRLSLASPRTPDALAQLGDGLYAEVANNPRRSLAVGFAGEGALGRVRGGALEASNTDLTTELIMLIEAQRSFQSNAKALESSSKLIENLVQK